MKEHTTAHDSPTPISRQHLLKALGFGAATVAGVSAFAAPAEASPHPVASLAMKNRMWLSLGVKDFGAKGDGSTDDTEAIQDAIDHVADAGGGVVTVPRGVYMISSPISVRSNVALVGEGDASVIRAFQDRGWTLAVYYHGMLEVLEESNTAIRDLCVDQNGVGRDNSKFPMAYSMVVSGSNHCDLTNITFVGQGRDTKWPTGPALLIISKDVESATIGGVVGKDTSHVTVSGCRFIQDDRLHLNFAVRVYTTFDTAPTADPPSVSVTDVTIQNCYFQGLWGWNTVEFAGRTQYSRVLSCRFEGLSFTHIDFDKGTSNCVAAFNTIEGAGKPPHLLGSTVTRVAVINDHGNANEESDTVRSNFNNVIAYNVIKNTVTDGAVDTKEAAIMIGKAAFNSQVIGNRISNVNNGQIGGGIQFQRLVNGAVVRDNVVEGVKYGIWFDDNFGDFDGIRIEGNTVVSEAEGIYVNKLPGNGVDFLISHNRVSTNGSTPAISCEPGTMVAPVILANTAEGGAGYQLAGSDATVIGNVATGAATASFTVGEPATLIGNVSLSPGANDLTVAAGAPQPRLSANSFTGPNADLSPTTTYAAAPPTTGGWRQGDVVYNSAPSAGAAFAWTCVADGTPGTWKAVATIAN